MSYTIRPAQRSSAKPLIGFYAESGCGKTYPALLLAKGYVGDMTKVVMIETESGRGEVYADHPVVGGYQIISMRDNFSPQEYGLAIDAANKAEPGALIIDSASHEWEGVGGVLDMAAKNQAEGKTGQIVWQRPKMDHQTHFMLRLMQTPIPLVIVCMRAKYPMEQFLNDKGKKDWRRSEKLDPKQSEDILFEMMIHAWHDTNHFIHITKPRGDDDPTGILTVFHDGQRINVETGKALAEWAKGGTKKEPDIDFEVSARVLTDLLARIEMADTIELHKAIGEEYNKGLKKAMTKEGINEFKTAYLAKAKELQEKAA